MSVSDEGPILSRVAFRGHPIHPMVIHFPIAALVMLIGTDLAYVWTGDSFWARASLWLAGVGAGGGWVASIAGLVDLAIVPRVRKLITGWCHAIVAVMMLSLATLNWVLRWDDAQEAIWPWGVYLSLLTAAVMGMAAILGGRLVYEHTVGVHVQSS